MDYAKISKETIGHLYTAHTSLNNSSLSKELRALLELRVSQINGCSYCINLHRGELVKYEIANEKIEELPNFTSSNLYSNAEKEALHWSEKLTYLKQPQKVKDTNLAEYLSEREIVDITICISMMNMFNRIAISMRDD